MEQSLYSFNSYTLVLSSPPPLSSQLIMSSAIIKGITKITLDYTLLNFSVNPYKVILNWPGEDATIINSEFTNLSALIYIQTTPEVCLERTHIRNRKGEESIPLSYLSSCHNYHENWIIDNNNVPLLILNGNNVIETSTLITFINNLNSKNSNNNLNSKNSLK